MADHLATAAAFEHGTEQGRVALIVLRVDVGAFGQKHAGGGQIELAHRDVKRGFAMMVARVDIGARDDQRTDTVDVVFRGGIEQGRAAVAVGAFHAAYP